jgi:hypothetical protein
VSALPDYCPLMDASSDGGAATHALQAAVGSTLIQFRMGYGLHMEFDTNDQLEITVEQTLVISSGGTAWTGEPVSGECANALIPSLLSPLREVEVTEEGRLRLALGEATITVEPHPDFEAWQARSQTGLLVVCTPGGGTANWLPG